MAFIQIKGECALLDYKSAVVCEENKLASSSREKHDAQKRKHKDRQTA